jgi:hypothetical protein
MPNRMDLREGEQTTSLQRLGRAAEALHYALCQSTPSTPGQQSVIRLFPAWPDEWEAEFSLLWRDGFIVSSLIHEGVIKYADILSRNGKECSIKNPWPSQEVQIYRNGKRSKKQKGDIIIVSTKVDDLITIAPVDSAIDKITRGLSVD